MAAGGAVHAVIGELRAAGSAERRIVAVHGTAGPADFRSQEFGTARTTEKDLIATHPAARPTQHNSPPPRPRRSSTTRRKSLDNCSPRASRPKRPMKIKCVGC